MSGKVSIYSYLWEKETGSSQLLGSVMAFLDSCWTSNLLKDRKKVIFLS